MGLSGKAILIVEDEFLIALDLEETLREAGATVLGPAETAKRALQIIQEKTVTTAILDINLGDGNSLAVAEQLAIKKIPFVYHTGQSEFLDASDWPDAPVMSKPASPAGVVSTLTNLLKEQ